MNWKHRTLLFSRPLQTLTSVPRAPTAVTFLLKTVQTLKEASTASVGRKEATCQQARLGLVVVSFLPFVTCFATLVYWAVSLPASHPSLSPPSTPSLSFSRQLSHIIFLFFVSCRLWWAFRPIFERERQVLRTIHIHWCGSDELWPWLRERHHQDKPLRPGMSCKRPLERVSTGVHRLARLLLLTSNIGTCRPAGDSGSVWSWLMTGQWPKPLPTLTLILSVVYSKSVTQHLREGVDSQV